MSFIAVVRHDAGRILKFAPFETLTEAQGHAATFGGFASPQPTEGRVDNWVADELAQTVSYVAPEPVPATSQEVTNYAEQLIEQGVTVNITGLSAPVYVQGRDKDTRNVQGLATGASLRIGAGDTTTLTPFRDGNNVVHHMTSSQVIEMWQKSAAYVSAVYSASWQIKDDTTINPDFRSDSRWPNPDQTMTGSL